MSATPAPMFDLDQLPTQPGAPAPNMQLKGGRRRKSAGRRKSVRRRKTGRRRTGRRRTGRRMRYN